MSAEAGAGPLRLGLIGCGRVAENGYLPALGSAPGLALVGVAEPDRSRRERAARLAAATPRPGGRRSAPPAFESGAALLDALALDAVVIATPPERHLDDAVAAAERGLPALVEKPPAPDTAGAARMAALRPAPWVGFNRRFQQGESLRARVPPQGSVRMELELRYRRRSWRPHTVRTDALADLGPHLVDLAFHLSGAELLAVRAARCGAQRAELELATSRGPARIRCATDRPHLERVWIDAADGDGGLLDVVGGRWAALRRLGPPGRPGRPHPLLLSLSSQLRAFERAVRGLAPGPLATAAEGATVMRAIEAARASAALAGAEVELSPTGPAAPSTAAAGEALPGSIL